MVAAWAKHYLRYLLLFLHMNRSILEGPKCSFNVVSLLGVELIYAYWLHLFLWHNFFLCLLKNPISKLLPIRNLPKGIVFLKRFQPDNFLLHLLLSFLCFFPLLIFVDISL